MTNTGVAVPAPVPGNATNGLLATPSLARSRRKINLNYPLPVSNNPQEPIRLKWISDTYHMLKAILPPKAVDTPQELAQLSQFVINIIDFRDPDGAVTMLDQPRCQGGAGRTADRDGVPSLQHDLPGPREQRTDHSDSRAARAIRHGILPAGAERDPRLLVHLQGRYPAGSASMPTRISRFFVELSNMLTDSYHAQGTPPSPAPAPWT